VLAIVVATAPEFASGAVLAAVDAFAHIVPTALLAAACRTEALEEEAGHIAAEAVGRAAQAAQNVPVHGAAVAVVKFGYVLEAAVEAAADGFGIVEAAVHIDGVSAVGIHLPGRTEAAEGEAVAAQAVPPDSPVRRSWDRRSVWCT
jgi:hypothetical protein